MSAKIVEADQEMLSIMGLENEKEDIQRAIMMLDGMFEESSCDHEFQNESLSFVSRELYRGLEEADRMLMGIS